MAKVGFVGLTFVDSSGKKKTTKFGWSKGELAKLIGPANAVALQRAGLLVRRESQRQIVGGRGGRKPLTNGQWWRVGEKDGYPVVAYVRQVPRADKLSSWRPRAMLRNDIQADFDTKTKSVVIGPSKFPWLNQLHEFGEGTVSVYVRRTKYPVKEYAGKKVPQKYQRKGPRAYRGAYVGTFDNSGGNFFVGIRKVKERPYMEPGFMKAKPDIPKQFRATLGYR
jgi:hypothetical protein